MSFREIPLKPVYDPLEEDVCSSFYEPLLSKAVSYDRASAYFDSNILSLYGRGIEGIVQNGGHVRFVFSCQIEPDDFQRLKQGYELRGASLDRILAQIKVEQPSDAIKNIAYLISIGVVDVKIAFTYSQSGIFHDKFGLIYSREGDVILFNGSNNETAASAKANSEGFNVNCSWMSDEWRAKTIDSYQKKFESLWTNTYPATVVRDIPSIVKNQIIDYSCGRLILKAKNYSNAVVFGLGENKQLAADNNLDDPSPFSSSNRYFGTYIAPNVESQNSKRVNFQKGMRISEMRGIIDTSRELAEKIGFSIILDDELERFFEIHEINQAQMFDLGRKIKHRDESIMFEFNRFAEKVQSLVVRPLATSQLWGAFHLYKLKKAANFSVPGAGKTATVLGAFAYLKSKGLVDRIVVVGPLNSFMAWKDEFSSVFGDKIPMSCFDYSKNRSSPYDSIRKYVPYSVLSLFNYESLPKISSVLAECMGDKVFLVFDEAHRIKSADGIRAKAALEIAGEHGPVYRAVLTGTPIPNGYQDAYNMMNIILAGNFGYEMGFSYSDLQACNLDSKRRDVFNYYMYPLFYVTTKEDLEITPPDPDDKTTGFCEANENEAKLFEIIRKKCEHDPLVCYTRLIQASCNPSLVLHSAKESVKELFFADEIDLDSEKDNNPWWSQNMLMAQRFSPEEKDFIAGLGMSSKFYKGIDLAVEEAKQGKKVLIWAIFIDTLEKIQNELLERGIRCGLICGKISLDEREKIIGDFKEGNLQVLIANPATLAESVSLHKSCHTAIYFEYSFDLVHMIQSKDRIHRLGLPPGTKTHYYFMILDNPNGEYKGLDSMILERLELKAENQSRLLNNDDITYEYCDTEQEIADLIAGSSVYH